jgi:hypothetical protein
VFCGEILLESELVLVRGVCRHDADKLTATIRVHRS